MCFENTTHSTSVCAVHAGGEKEGDLEAETGRECGAYGDGRHGRTVPREPQQQQQVCDACLRPKPRSRQRNRHILYWCVVCEGFSLCSPGSCVADSGLSCPAWTLSRVLYKWFRFMTLGDDARCGFGVGLTVLVDQSARSGMNARALAPRHVSFFLLLFSAQGRDLPRRALEGCRCRGRRELLSPDPRQEPPVPDVRLLDPPGNTRNEETEKSHRLGHPQQVRF